MESYELTAEQDKAVDALERALKKCAEAGVYLWDNYGTISAVNALTISSIVTSDHGEPLDHDQVRELRFFTSKGTGGLPLWRAANADDALFVER